MEPFSPTPFPMIRGVLTAVDLKPYERFVDLGSGDGRVVREAVHSFNCDQSYGVEILVELVAKSNAYQVPSVSKQGDLCEESLTDIDVATLFIIHPETVAAVVGNAVRMKPGSRLVVMAEVPGVQRIEVEGCPFWILER